MSLARSFHLFCAFPRLNVGSVTCWVCPMLFPALFWIRFSPGLRVLWCFLCHTVLVGGDEVWFALQLADFLVCLKCILLGLSLLTFILLSFLFAFLGPCPWEVFCPTVLQLAHVVSLQHHAVLLVASSWTRPLALCRDLYSVRTVLLCLLVFGCLPFFFLFLSAASLALRELSSVWLADLCLAIWCLLGLPLCPL